MKRFQLTEAEYEAIKAKEAKTKDKTISCRLRVLMLRYEGNKVEEIARMLNLNKGSIARMCSRYREQGLEEYARNKYESHRWLLSWEREEEILNQFKETDGKQVTAHEIKGERRCPVRDIRRQRAGMRRSSMASIKGIEMPGEYTAPFHTAIYA